MGAPVAVMGDIQLPCINLPEAVTYASNRAPDAITETSAEARAVPARSPHLGRVRLPLAARPPARPGQVLQVRELDAVEGVRGAYSQG